MWKVPLFDLNFDHEEEAAVLETLRSRWLTSGPKTGRFEAAFSEYLGGCFSLALSSGTGALHLALLAGGIAPGDEVIVSGLSFVAALNVVSLVGGVPVLADCSSLTDWNVSPADIARKITPRTRALIVVHFAGYPCDMEPILALAREHGLLVIEDAAHAVGARYRGAPCGTLGDIGCFSFFSNKNLSTGEGGMLVTRRPELHEAARLLRSHGMSSMTIERHMQRAVGYDVVRPGLNYRFDEIRASLGLAQLAKLDQGNEKRKELTYGYRALLGPLAGVVLPFAEEDPARLSCYHIFPVLLPVGADRARVGEALRGEGIQTSLHYPAYCSFSGYRHLGQVLPVAEEISSRVLTLPLFPTMGMESVQLVAQALRRALAQ